MKKKLLLIISSCIAFALLASAPTCTAAEAEQAIGICEESSQLITLPRTIFKLLEVYLREKRYYAILSPGASKPTGGNAVDVTFWESPTDSPRLAHEAIIEDIRNYCLENNIDTDYVNVIFEEEEEADNTDSTLITDPWTIREMLEEHIKEKGYNAGVGFMHEEMIWGTICKIKIVFLESPVGEQDSEVSKTELSEFIKASNLDSSLIGIVTYGEAAETTTAAETTSAASAETDATTSASAETTTTTASAATTAAASSTTAAPPQTGSSTGAGIFTAAIAALLSAAASNKRRKH